MSDLFCEPSAEEKSAVGDLTGKRISIFWDGDSVFFSAKIVNFDKAANVHNVKYDNDDTGDLYPETLDKQPWKIWTGTEQEFSAYNLMKVEEEKMNSDAQESELAAASKSAGSSMKMSYSVMAVEAVIALNERHGSSLVAIRKYMQANYPLKQQQTASFNSLTLKGVSKAVATNELEKLKHSYKVTLQEKEKRKGRDRKANYLASSHSPRGSKHKKKGGKGGKKGGKSSSSNIYGYYYAGTAAETNRPRRRDMERLKERRDDYLEEKKDLLMHFLTDNDYFKKKEKREKKGIEKKKKKEEEEAVATTDSINGVIDEVIEDSGVIEDNGMIEAAAALVGASAVWGSSSSAIVGPACSTDDMSAADALLSAGQSSIVTAEAVSVLDQAAIQLETEPGLVPEITADIGDDKPTSDEKLEEEVKLEEIIELEEEEEEEEVIEPGEQVSYAMRNVPLVPQPPTLIAELHEHQIQGISWMAHMFSQGMPMILGDQMGLGKTIQSIGLLAHLQSAMGQGGPHLVVVPLSVLSNWLAEIERFCPSMRAVRFHGPKAERNRIKTEELSDTTEFDIVVTTFEILVSEVNFFKRKYVWTTIIVDEGHRLKNEKSQLSEKLRSVSCLSKIILTGTPLQNNLRELWALLHFLAPDVFTPATAERFETGFDLVRGLVDSKLLRRARRLLGVFMLRRVKDQVAISLPSRRELTVLVPLTDRQVVWYKRLLCGLDSDVIETVMRESTPAVASAIANAIMPEGSDSLALTVKPKGSSSKKDSSVLASSSSSSSSGGSGDSDWRKLMNLLLQLRKICNHIYLMPDAAPDPYDVGEHVVGGSGKLLMLDRMLPRLRQDGHRVLLFSQFTSMLDLLEDYCELRDLPYVRLDGETNRVQRRLDVRRFNAPNSPLFIFLISTRAGGLGLNLASADTVILYDSDWNPQVDLQAMERAHRIGQVKPVRVYRLVCSGSVEERMVSRAEKKLFLNAMVAETDPDELEGGEKEGEGENGEEEDVNQALGIGGATMSKGELASLIRFGANAVFESAGNTQISDCDLDKLLERQGRDKPSLSTETEIYGQVSIASSSSSSAEKASANALAAAKAMAEGLAMDDLDAVQAALRDRMELLTEVDLRQLGDTLYTRRKSKPKNEGVDVKNIVGMRGDEEGDDADVAEDFTANSNGKRVRKERITMVDGKGTGYGGAVPMLTESMDRPAAAPVISRHRSRAWTHMEFCAFCAKSKSSDANCICKCAHCPRVFHTDCMEEKGIPKSSGMFICPHHKCASCSRSTAAAGGLLFRCMGCLTSYCEDCLPQDEIESVGRCRSMEELGYESKQSYYIMCPNCCLQDGVTAKGVVGDKVNDGEEADDEADGEDDEEEEETDAGGKLRSKNQVEPEVLLLPTQLMRVVWDEEPDSEVERSRIKAAKKAEKDRIKKEEKEAAERKKKGGKGQSKGNNNGKIVVGRGKKPLLVEDSSDEEESEEEEAPRKKGSKLPLPVNRKAANGSSKAVSKGSSQKKVTPTATASSGSRRKTQEPEESESEEEESEEEEDEEYSVAIPVRCELGDALNILLSHPRAQLLDLCAGGSSSLSSLSAAAPTSASSQSFTVTLSSIQTKLASGRYRSVLPFVSDVRAFLKSFMTKKVKAGSAAIASIEEEPTKRRRFPVLPPPVRFSRGKGMSPNGHIETEAQIASDTVEVLTEFFDNRLLSRLAIL